MPTLESLRRRVPEPIFYSLQYKLVQELRLRSNTRALLFGSSESSVAPIRLVLNACASGPEVAVLQVDINTTSAEYKEFIVPFLADVFDIWEEDDSETPEYSIFRYVKLHSSANMVGRLARLMIDVSLLLDPNGVSLRSAVHAYGPAGMWAAPPEENADIDEVTEELAEVLVRRLESGRVGPGTDAQWGFSRLNSGGPARVALNAEDFEQVSAEFMRAAGFTDAARTKRGPDGGVDVIARKAIAQSKFYSNGSVGHEVILQLAGSRQEFGVEYALCFAWATGFTASAIEKARRLGILLFQFNPNRPDGSGFDRIA